MSKWTKGAKWDLSIRFEDGFKYRIWNLPDKVHTNETMLESIAQNFIPLFRRAQARARRAKKRGGVKA